MPETSPDDAPPGTAALAFPTDFLWGASTSAYQIEGATNEDGRGPSVWDTFCRMTGRVNHGHTGDIACDHYHRYGDDVRLMKDLGIGAYRFSLAWPRVLPRGRGVANQAGLDFYDRLIDTLLEAGIEPWATLFHWDLPQALDDLGGWTNRDSAGWFADYATIAARRFGDRVKHWATFNEFSVFTLFGYAFGWAPPSISDKAAHLKTIHHVNLAHGDATAVLRAHVPGAAIGAIHSVQPCRPSSDAPEDIAATALFNEHWNLCFPDAQILGTYPPQIGASIEPYVRAGDMARICQPMDWFGLNHYAPMYAKADPGMLWGFVFGALPENLPRTGVGWPIDPSAFEQTLKELTSRYRLPIYVTENGYGSQTQPAPNERAELDDQGRVAYLAGSIEAMHRALRDGAKVRGYFVWSLLDNFEWGAGYGDRFGIVFVDYATQERIPKASARWYAALIKSQKAPPNRPKR
ncbi:GH1 family beta-glucosidase [Telmatospirillum sp.]|uniref:GH1 family beta-glucosidase n=1 Tax=Telmatospirillum sp. TaxID=2079197 RepID=UPI002852062A|nr:GH1 family beta-glucosidase [Telmatospirillum sp.]MDR3438389.1 GH1 family beta-glucosidase [Telmatospirillum sp.]